MASAKKNDTRTKRTSPPSGRARRGAGGPDARRGEESEARPARGGGRAAAAQRRTGSSKTARKSERTAKPTKNAGAKKASARKAPAQRSSARASTTRTSTTRGSTTRKSSTRTSSTRTSPPKVAPTQTTLATPVTRAPTSKPSTEASAKRAAAAGAGPRLVGTAGRRILGHLGLTDAELFAFLPADAPKWLRGVLWCQFDLAHSLDDIEAHFRGRYETSFYDDVRFPPDGPEEGVPVRTLTLRPPGRYVAYTFYGMRDEAYVESGSYQLEANFGAMGTVWGSNRAIYERFTALELSELGATNVRERTE